MATVNYEPKLILPERSSLGDWRPADPEPDRPPPKALLDHMALEAAAGMSFPPHDVTRLLVEIDRLRRLVEVAAR